MATAAAPTYYKRHRTAEDVGLLDGGVWANNPIALAVVEAVTLLDWPASSLRVLSLGCVNEVYMIGEAPGWGGLRKGCDPPVHGRPVAWRAWYGEVAYRPSIRT